MSVLKTATAWALLLMLSRLSYAGAQLISWKAPSTPPPSSEESSTDYETVSVPAQDVADDHLVPPEDYDYEFPPVQGTRVPYMSGSTSRHWGWSGELYDASGRMPDWSWVGYRMGEADIPNKPATHDLIRNFGAVPNDGQSDFAAFSAAFSSIPSGGVLYIPPGTYVLDRPITRSIPIVIRGAGRDATKIYLPNSLDALYGPWKAKATPNNPLSPWRDSPHLITLNGAQTVSQSTLIGSVVSNAARGTRMVSVSLNGGANPQPGQMVRMVASDRGGSLVNYLYGGLGPKDWGKQATNIINKGPLIFFISRIRGVTKQGNTAQVELERLLPFDLRPFDWNGVQMHRIGPSVMYESGIEDLAFEWAPSVYAGHLVENGYNTLGMYGCVHCWVRRIRITNADIGLDVANSHFVTVDDVVINFNTDRTGGKAGRFDGHHALRFSRSVDCIMKNIQILGTFLHDLSVDHMASLNVYHNVIGENLSMDFHSEAPCMNLMSRINCGKCTRAWMSGGSATSGGHAGLYNWGWGLTGGDASTNMAPPWAGFGYGFTIVAGILNQIPTYNGFELEPLDPGALQPFDLQASQLANRIANLGVMETYPTIWPPEPPGVVSPPPDFSNFPDAPPIAPPAFPSASDTVPPRPDTPEDSTPSTPPPSGCPYPLLYDGTCPLGCIDIDPTEKVQCILAPGSRH